MTIHMYVSDVVLDMLVCLVEVSMRNDIPKCYSRELSMTNNRVTPRTYIRMHWPRCGPGLAASR